MIDSLMDLLSGAIIWYSARLRSNTSDGHRYPVGKARMEPLGIIVFASVMVTSFLQVMLQSFERLLAGADEPVDLGIIILSLLGLNIFIKFALWAWCRTMKDSSSVQALAQDHLNDVVFNVFSTLFPVAGQFMGWWWLDAVGAVVLSIYIITEWTGTCLHNIRRLTGQAATAADIQQLTYMAYRFSNLIQAIDTVRAYYVGDGLFVEVDIVLPPDTPLSQAHDVGESLQGALERLDSVERAFVHVDYNAVHAIEHR
ncbi:cation efflux protein [Gamsiella multidivaricata]|uniref:cation efflux protein n=1 Tax=Gamsiella multidivaricata TaxID=101098 RepID=UPI00221ED589|nr:cation efflux protein [Gamsiella multidivaricata]KAI7824776.1 cation efflux protein [Gamsiella multidivaricata]